MKACTDISGRVAVVTGGTSGIGRGICVSFAKLGWKVAFTGRTAEKGEKALATIKQESGCGPDELLFVQGDVAEEGDVIAMFEKVVAGFGRVDFLVNNAGICPEFPLSETDSEVFDNVMKVNVYGVFYGMKHGMKQMKLQGLPEQGVYAVVNMASLTGVTPFAACGANCASKHAVIGMTRAAAKEAASYGIKLNSMCPGLIKTEMLEEWSDSAIAKLCESQSIGRMGKVEEIADGVMCMCTAPFMIGHQLVMDGAWTCY